MPPWYRGNAWSGACRRNFSSNFLTGFLGLPKIISKVLLTQPNSLPRPGRPPPEPGRAFGFSHHSGLYAPSSMRPGEPVPDFELPAQDGTPVRLSEELNRGPVVLFFYPRALTPGCTKESCHFRDLEAEFAAVGREPARDQRRSGGPPAAVLGEARARLPAAVRRRPDGGPAVRGQAPGPAVQPAGDVRDRHRRAAAGRDPLRDRHGQARRRGAGRPQRLRAAQPPEPGRSSSAHLRCREWRRSSCSTATPWPTGPSTPCPPTWPPRPGR